MRLPRRFAATAGLLGLSILLAGPGRATRDSRRDDLAAALARSRAVERAVHRARPAVVAIRALGKGRDGFGAGIVVSPEGEVLTARHVVTGATALAVILLDGTEAPARIAGVDRASDLALLRLLAPGRSLTPAELGQDQELEPGATVLALSNPFGIGISVSRGVLSARDRRGVVPGVALPLLQTDAAINPGSSGGALVNLRGEVVGLILAILTRTGGHQGVGFALPACELRRALPYLRRGESVRRPWLGVRVGPDPAGGIVVRAVLPESPASRAGLAVGDRILALAGRKLHEVGDLRAVLGSAVPGAELPIELERGGRLLRLRIGVGWKKP